MRFAVLGAGLQGSACAFDLLRQGEVEQVVLLDHVLDHVPPFLRDGWGDRLKLQVVDFEDDDAVRAALAGCQVALSAAPYYFNYELARLAVEEGAHYADLGGNTEIVFRQKGLDAKAQEGGLSVIPDVGLAPGMVNILAAHGIEQLDRTDRVKLYVGGLPQDPEPPLYYEVVYSLEGALDYYTTPSWILRDGKRVQIDALSEVEELEFPELGTCLEAFHTGGGISTLPWTYEGRVRVMEYKTLRYPGHVRIMRAVRDLGLLDLDPVEVAGVEVVPREVFIEVVSPRLKRPEGRDLVALRVVVEGTQSGDVQRLVWQLIDRYDEQNGISAMERTTGYSLSIVGMMQAKGQVKRLGVATPDESVAAEPYIRELAKRGVQIRFEGG